jgi:hypothetical protein
MTNQNASAGPLFGMRAHTITKSRGFDRILWGDYIQAKSERAFGPSETRPPSSPKPICQRRSYVLGAWASLNSVPSESWAFGAIGSRFGRVNRVPVHTRQAVRIAELGISAFLSPLGPPQIRSLHREM